MKVEELKQAYLRDHGYVHKIEYDETYKCKPYKPETARYARPKPDPDGTAEFTHHVTKEVVDELADCEFATLLTLEQNKLLTDLCSGQAKQNKYLDCVNRIESAVGTIKQIMIGFAVLVGINVLLTIYMVVKMGSALL